jgi:hypothetical protein
MDVVVRLRGLGLGKYEAAFRENEIDETVLPDLTTEDLKELGAMGLMALFGYPVAQENDAERRRFWQASAQRRSSRPPSSDCWRKSGSSKRRC